MCIAVIQIIVRKHAYICVYNVVYLLLCNHSSDCFDKEWLLWLLSPSSLFYSEPISSTLSTHYIHCSNTWKYFNVLYPAVFISDHTLHHQGQQSWMPFFSTSVISTNSSFLLSFPQFVHLSPYPLVLFQASFWSTTYSHGFTSI